MKPVFTKQPVALAALAALASLATLAIAPAAHAAKPAGTYVTGDFHNHTTCSDGSISMQKLVKKSTDKTDTPWGLDWFVQAGHGGNGNRNCTLAEDASLATPAYPLVYAADGVTVVGPNTTWQSSTPPVEPQGTPGGSRPNQNMWRWQAIQQFQYPLAEYLNALKNVPLFLGMESVVAGHEHTSMSVITGQVPAAIDNARCRRPRATRRSATPTRCRSGPTASTAAPTATSPAVGPNSWNCAVPGSANESNVSWNAPAAKALQGSGTGNGDRGHAEDAGRPEVDGPVPPAGQLLRARPPGARRPVQPGRQQRLQHRAPAQLQQRRTDRRRGLRVAARPWRIGQPRRIFAQPQHHRRRARRLGRRHDLRRHRRVRSQVGGVWDALLGEGRNWWFFGSSDWHNRGMFGPDDRRSTQDFYPGEYQRDAVMVRKGDDTKLRPQAIVDGIRSGNSFVASAS
jgi:hypothetical protein